MYITTSYNSSVYSDLINSTNTSQSKSLVDYLKDDNEEKSGVSDTVSLSKEAYAAIQENNPELLDYLGYEDRDDSALTTGAQASSSLLDKVELSPEAYAVLKQENPEVLEALGYDTSKDEEAETTEE